MLDDQYIEQLLSSDRLATTHKMDARILDAAMAALGRSTHPKWDSLFRRRLVRHLSIAASLMMIVGVGIYLLLQREVSAAEMLHRVAVRTSGYTGWVHLKGQMVVTDQAGGSHTTPAESYIHPADGSEANVYEREGKRSVRLYIPSRFEVIEYDSASNEIWMGTPPPNPNQPPPAGEPTFSWLLGVLQNVNQNAHITASRTRENDLERYDLVYAAVAVPDPESQPAQLIQHVWVDPATQRIRKMQGQRDGQTLTLEWIYGNDSINDIYDLDVPRDAKIVDTRPQAHEAQIAADFNLNALRWELKRRVDAGFGDHTAIVMQSHIEKDGALDAWFVHVIRKRGSYERSDELYVGHNQEISTLRQYVVKAWPKLTFGQVFELEAKGPVDSRVIRTPAEVLLSNNFLSQGVRKLPVGGEFGQWSMAKLTWDYRQSFEPDPGNHEKVDLSLLPIGTRPEKWIGVRAVHTDKDVQDKPRQRTVDYWYDPLKGYVLMERSTQYDDNPENTILWSKRSTLDVVQAPTGTFYPTHIQETLRIRSGASGRVEVVDSGRDEHILLDTSLIPEEGLFAANQASTRQLIRKNTAQ